MRRFRLFLAVLYFSTCTSCAWRAIGNGDCFGIAGSFMRVSDYKVFCTKGTVALLGKDEEMSEVLGITGSQALVVGGLSLASPVAGGAAALVGMGEKAIEAITSDREPHEE